MSRRLAAAIRRSSAAPVSATEPTATCCGRELQLAVTTWCMRAERQQRMVCSWAKLMCRPLLASVTMADVAGVLEGLVLVPPPGGDGPLPPDVPVADLAVAGTYLIPLTDAVRARCHQAAGDTAVADGFYELTRGVARWAQELSRDWMVLYVYCEFWAGDGIHAAMAWHRGSVIFGPRFTRSRGETADPPYRAADGPDMAINAGLRALGIHAAGCVDEFAAIGLGRHRWTSEWES